MLSCYEIADISRPYAMGKPGISVSVGIIAPAGISRYCVGVDGTIIPAHDHTYEIGSITKTFVASLIASLRPQGAVCLKDIVRSGITVEQLLTHSSGIQEYPLPQTRHENPFSNVTAQDLLSFIDHSSTGEKVWEYSNTGFALIGIFLQEKLGRPFTQLLEDFVRNDLHLQHTYIGYQGAELSGHNGNHVFQWRWEKNSAFLPAGCLVSSLEDMLQYLQIHMSLKDYGICHQTHLVTQMPFDMGLAFMKQKETGIIFAMGLTDGFSSFIGFDSKKRYGCVVLSNYCGPGYGEPDTPNGIGFSILNRIHQKAIAG